MQKRFTDILNEKQNYIERIEELEHEIKATQLKMVDLNSENDKYSTESHDKLRIKDMNLEKVNEELKHVKSI